MYQNYKIVCNTAAGRRRYMQYLIPPILASDIIDRYDIWINTVDLCDIEFFKKLAEKYPKVNLVWHPDGVINGSQSIDAFYRYCLDEDTIYLRLDDDVVWVEPGFFEKIIKFRVEHPEYFVISPLVINNPKSTYILQVKDKLKLRRYGNAETFHDVFWQSGEFAYELHTWFLNNYLKTNRYQELHCGSFPIGVTRFSINSICWFGKDLKPTGGLVERNEEEYMSCILPTRLGKACCYYCDTMIAHFAFYTQRKMLDKKDILSQYGAYLHEQWKSDPRMTKLDDEIQALMKDVAARSEQINRGSCPYTSFRNKRSIIIRLKLFLKFILPHSWFLYLSNKHHAYQRFILG